MAEFHLGYYVNRYAKWYRIRHFADAVEMVRWLRANSDFIDGAIDFISEGVSATI